MFWPSARKEAPEQKRLIIRTMKIFSPSVTYLCSNIFFRKDLKKNIKYQAAEINRRKDRKEKTRE